MRAFQRRINLFHYNIWRFERWTRYLVFGDNRITTITEKENEELADRLPFAAGPIDESELPNYTGKHFLILVMLTFFTLLNFCVAKFSLSFQTFWFYGLIVSGVLSILIAFRLTPMPFKTDSQNILLEDFKEFERMQVSEKRLSALITFFVVVGIWVVSILSFIFYLRALTLSQ